MALDNRYTAGIGAYNPPSGLAAANGVASRSAIKGALNSVAGTQSGNTAAKQGAFNSMAYRTDPVQNRMNDPSLTTSPLPSSGAAASQAVKSDPMQQALANAMMQKMMQDQAKAQQPTKDGSYNVDKLSPRMQKEIETLAAEMNKFKKQMMEQLKTLKNDGKVKDEDAVDKSVNALKATLDEHFSTDAGKRDKFNPAKVMEATDKTLKVLSEGTYKDDKAFDPLRATVTNIQDTAGVAKNILERNSDTLLKVADKTAEFAGKDIKELSDKVVENTKADDEPGNKFLASLSSLTKSLDNYQSKDADTRAGSVTDIKTNTKDFTEAYNGLSPEKQTEYKAGYEKITDSLNIFNGANDLSRSSEPISENNDDAKALSQEFLKYLDENHAEDKNTIIDDLGINPAKDSKSTEETPDLTKLDLKFDGDDSLTDQVDEILNA